MSEIIITCGVCGTVLVLPATKDLIRYKCPACGIFFDFLPTQNPINDTSPTDFGLSKLEEKIKSLDTEEDKITKNTGLKKIGRKNIKNKKTK